MAKRPIFIPEIRDGLIREETIDFQWFPGFSTQQKQRSIHALHERAGIRFGWDPNYILEVSTKSHQRLGVSLSAFNLTLPRPAWYEERFPDSPEELYLESIYQGSKVFGDGRGPHFELLGGTPRRAKQFIQNCGLRNEAPTSFCYGQEVWPAEPGKTAFYDYLYLQALTYAESEKGIDVDRLVVAKAFTDIEFNPKASLNCQARSCALFVVLKDLGELDIALEDLGSFLETVRGLERKPIESPQMQLAD